MARKIPTETRRNERITSLVSIEERKRMDAYITSERLGMSEFIRLATMDKVEAWEKWEKQK